MEIIHLTAECYPVAKVGGLGDVLGALPKYQCKAGHFAKVVMPAYQTKFMQENTWQKDYEAVISLGKTKLNYQVLKESTQKLGFDLYCILIEGLTNTPNIYSDDTNTEKFVAFQIAALDWLAQWHHRPDIIHCHDQHAALVPFMLKYCQQFEHLKNIKTVFTIHNGVYQGWFPWSKSNYLPAFDPWKSGLLDWDHTINPMSSAVRCADAISTVSWSYMQELMEQANGLEGLFRQMAYKCFGVLNGIDYDVWNPNTDTYLSHHYTAENVDAIKQIHKQEICASFRLNSAQPLIVFIGRLVGEKGADLLSEAIRRAISETQGKVNFLILGSGETQVENQLSSLKSYFEGAYNCYIGYNETLAHRLYAAADFILMPSRVEPCGLNQMYALRYGTIPMVRNTGGLRDTVVDFGDVDGYGIRFNQASVEDIVMSTHRALQLYHHPTLFASIRQRIMSFNNSWELSQENYENIYKRILL